MPPPLDGGEEFCRDDTKTMANIAVAGGTRMAHGQDAAPDKARVRVRIGDEEYVLRGEASPEYMKQLAKTVDETFTRLQALYRNVPRHRVAILTAIHLADEVNRLRQENNELMSLLEEVK